MKKEYKVPSLEFIECFNKENITFDTSGNYENQIETPNSWDMGSLNPDDGFN